MGESMLARNSRNSASRRESSSNSAPPTHQSRMVLLRE
ncbi:hypothetical protein SpCBS45565_g08322 [Spizellomyces sp. 'palustris']|nr:hypothetical protein SpCBS45565_g08322 [Spizellomyces sp. 'palustris']